MLAIYLLILQAFFWYTNFKSIPWIPSAGIIYRIGLVKILMSSYCTMVTDISDKIVESLCSKRKNQYSLGSLPEGESSIIGSDNITDELDLRISSVLQSTGHCYEGGLWTDSANHDVSDGKRHVAIVTTASLPWMTGTAVNPLFRAAYLAKSAKQNVTLLVPWLCRADQELVYPTNVTFSSPEEQEVYIRKWLEERVGFKADFKISFYPGKVLLS